MYYLYLLKSLSNPDKTYIGFTANLQERLKKHNSGGSVHTVKYKPWELMMYLGFKKAEL